MAHFAEINDKNIVVRVLVTDNNDPNGDEGYQFLIDNLGGTWVKTSYNAAINGFRYNYAGIGYTYDPIDDAFISPIPCKHDSLILTRNKQWDCSKCEAIAKESMK